MPWIFTIVWLKYGGYGNWSLMARSKIINSIATMETYDPSLKDVTHRISTIDGSLSIDNYARDFEGIYQCKSTGSPSFHVQLWSYGESG